MPLRNDIVTIGNYTARIKNYYPSNGVMVLFDVYPYDAQANIVAGMTMTTQDGGGGPYFAGGSGSSGSFGPGGNGLIIIQYIPAGVEDGYSWGYVMG